MKYCHKSEILETFLNKNVEIIFKDGTKYDGILTDYEGAKKQLNYMPLFKAPYFILVKSGVFVFSVALYKSYIKSIKLISEV